MADLAAAPPFVDPRLREYARLLVERCCQVQPGQQVLIRTSPLARSLCEELSRQIAAKDAYAIFRLDYTMWPSNAIWAAEAPLELMGEMPPADLFACENMDTRMTINAPEIGSWGADLPPERQSLMRKAERPFYRRSMSDEITWVSTLFPTPAVAQEAGMTLRAFEDFFYSACLLDWDEVGEKMRRYCDEFNAADEVRIVGEGTDLRLSLVDRTGEVASGICNMPDGEFFFSPREDSAEGTILYDVPTEFEGNPVEGISLEFRSGKVVNASAQRGEPALLAALDTDEGARFLGELGIGCNTGITRPMRNILFDEKIAGTVHLAVGAGYTKTGGTNVSAIHWDMIKDLRKGGRIELDGRVVQQDGAWVI